MNDEDAITIIESSFIHATKNPAEDKIKRAVAYKYLIKKSGLSVRAYAMANNIPNGTLQDWLLWAKLDETNLDSLKDSGMTETMIYRGLRGTRGDIEDTSNKKGSYEVNELDLKIEAIVNDLNSSQIENKASKYTYDKLDILKKAVERARFRLERNKPKIEVLKNDR
jgi:hypothetical protein